ncbi:hypothetical protein [Pedobacter sp. JCM 36344]|uniref:hypothetical protein n=1 Tax=Pedobacter sp. JCM 36344 TaxID=3374280 RepID=UPI00397DAD94
MAYLKKSNYTFNPDTFPFLGLSLFILVIMIFWRKLVSVFKPDTYVAEVETPVSQINEVLTKSKQIIQGHFVSGAGVITRYTISQARQNAEELSSLMKTAKNNSWYSLVLNFTFSDRNKRIKAILDPKLPSNYRKYVIQVYRDVFTSSRSLLADVRSITTTTIFGTSSWTTDLQKYFTL